MATGPAPLTIGCYLQSHDAASGRLRVNVLIVPTGDPREPLGADRPVPAAPAFAGTTIRLLAHPASDPGQVPTLADVPASGPVLELAPPAGQTAIFDALAAQFTITKPPVEPKRTAGRLIGKFLPASYRSAFGFTEARTKLAVTDDSYHCARRCAPSTLPPRLPQDPAISWGDAFAVLLRQPALARAAGLIHSVEVDAAPFVDGGFLFFDPAPGEPFHEQAALDAEFVRLYASRVPALGPAPGRSLFTPVLFPVAADAAAASALGSFDDAFSEALRFDDGFARVVHCRQPVTMDVNAPEERADGAAETRVPPATEHGIQIGWDDEDLVVTLNRQLSSTEPGKPDPAPAPPGFIGWCVDVRPKGTGAWRSLCAITSNGISLGPGAGVGPFTDELAVEVQPSRLGDRFWLQPYATRWRSRSIVAPSVTEEALGGNRNPASMPYAALAPDATPLRYGREYDFRVRMRDLTGGGPKSGDVPHHVGEAPVATWRLRRFVPLTQLDVEAASPDSEGLPTRFVVRRPRIRWPEAVYAGPDDALALLEERLADATAGAEVDVSLPDPDADFLEIRVLVRQPRFDQFAREDGYVEFYTAYRSFPAPVFDGPETPLTIDLAWRDATELGAAQAAPSTLAAPGSGPILLPTARDVRLELRAVARDDPSHFGNARARFGPVATVLAGVVRTPTAEPAILVAGAAADHVVTVFQRAPAAPGGSAPSRPSAAASWRPPISWRPTARSSARRVGACASACSASPTPWPPTTPRSVSRRWTISSRNG